ncbi:MAG: hypothetical protein JSW09_02005 [Pseudomonadota bacterium]|nr:MAG: hypothetical protein JSW09_02005 [Pseudomonadota bacterium]
MLVATVALPWGAWAEPISSQERAAEHTRAVELARAGDYDAGLEILARLLAVFPDDYGLRRDDIVVSEWKGDCDRALAGYEHIRGATRLENYLVRALANCAVRRAQEGEFDVALELLDSLLPHAPDPYPLERDMVVILAWQDKCEDALVRFEGIRADNRYEPYLALAVSDCWLQQGRRKEAAALLVESLQRYPQDTKVHHAWLKANVALRVDDRFDDERHAFELETGSDQDDAGLLEWRSRMELSTRIAARTRLFASYLVTRSDDRQYDAGNLHRAGIGIRHRFDAQWRFAQEFSTDLRNSGQNGSTTELIFEPRDTWLFRAAYATFAEDLPLRARAAGVESDRAWGDAEYNSLDYAWYGRASVSSYDFTDGNQRDAVYATIGYAYEMLPYREQRIYGEYYQSRNTREDAPYFNPSRDRSLGVVHRTDFVFDTRFKRHVDSVFLTLALYDQEGFDGKPKWAVRYEQDYDFDEFRSLNWGVGYARNYYDGLKEDELNAQLRLLWRF